MNTNNLIREALKGLLATGIEKVCVLGEEDAQEDLKRLREVYEDLILFWGLDEDLIDEFDEKIQMLNVNYNVLTLRRLVAETDENTKVILPDDIGAGKYKVKEVLQYIADMLE